MPSTALKPCSHPGCSALIANGSRCDQHKTVKPNSFADPERGSRHDRGYGYAWEQRRQRILKRDAGLCQACLANGIVNYCAGKKYGAHVDHIIPRSKGGSEKDSNLQTLCATCHRQKTAKEGGSS